MRFKNRKVLLAISLVGLAGVIFLIWQSLFAGLHEGHGMCPRMIPNYVLWLSLFLMVVVTVPLSYYFVSRRLEEKMERNLNTITKLANQRIGNGGTGEDTLTQNTDHILKLLNHNERTVMKKVIANKGSALQSEISRMEGMTKLKAHRAVKELERKGIVRLEPYSKTKRVVLSDDLTDIML